jgi:hypothetical protein
VSATINGTAITQTASVTVTAAAASSMASSAGPTRARPRGPPSQFLRPSS